jgi:hypothetical protein
VLQVPVPLQVAAGVSVFPVQVAAAHCVPEAYRWHALAPSQNPVWPQVEAATAHELQVPAQEVEQQMLWAQIPELHSLPAAQLAPLGLLPQVPAGNVQVFGDAQSAVLAQVILQTLFVVSHP